MRLKVLTTGLFILGIVLLFAWPFVIGERPSPDVSQKIRAAYVLRMGLYFIFAILTFFSAALCAFLLARKTREEFKEEAVDNFKELIEGTLQDHGKKPTE
jgi:hypothetical protein